MCLHNSAAPTRGLQPSRVSDLGYSTRNTSVNFDPSNLENFQAPSVDPLPRSDMNLCELSQSPFKIASRIAGTVKGRQRVLILTWNDDALPYTQNAVFKVK